MAIPMEEMRVIPCPNSGPAADARAGSALWPALKSVVARWARDPQVSRPRRVVFMVCLIWALSLIDLHLTIQAVFIGDFVEANPLARLFIHNPLALCLYKAATVLPITALLLAARRRWSIEIGCYFMCLILIGLMFLWMHYITHFAAI